MQYQPEPTLFDNLLYISLVESIQFFVLAHYLEQRDGQSIYP